MEYFAINEDNREKAGLLIKSYWGTTKMIVRGEALDLAESEGVFALENDETAGIVTYRVKDSVCEITSLASALEGKGIGTKLVDEAVRAAKENSCRKVILETTNDNINALRFYQKRGFDMVRIRRNSMEEARKMKPGIPLTGKNGIPLKHNIEFEMCLG